MAHAVADQIEGFHAHIYFDPDQLVQAQALGDAAAARFGVAVGHYHTAPVGPHPRGSCQLTVPSDRFGAVAQWLVLNRGALTIFAHALTGDELADHTKHVIWFGPSEALRLEIFERLAAR
jgi:DOPA 4,5-dioxygenase